MSIELRSNRAALSEVVLHYVEAGDPDAPAVVLLHGWPQTWLEWSLVMPGLARNFRVIAPDMRGFGDSSKPLTGYDARTVAGDVVELADSLGIGTFGLVGHDIGGMVGYALAATYRDRVSAYVFMDSFLPGVTLHERVNMAPPPGRKATGAPAAAQTWYLWHLGFHSSPMGEFLVRGREREYLTYWFREASYAPDAIPAEHVEAYVRAYSQPGALRGGFAHYGAIAGDVEPNRESAKEPLTIPVLAVGGLMGAEVEAEMRQVATYVRGEVLERVGHWIPEEHPDWVIERLTAFFTSGD